MSVKKLDSDNDLISQFQNIFTNITTFQLEPVLEYYETLFNSFLLLGVKLGFEKEEVYLAYLEKNKINHKRQDEGY